MKYVLKVYSIWEFGQRKDAAGNPHQEDSLYPPFGRQSDADRTFILCDGMGGHDAGEVASATVCETMAASILHDGHDQNGEFTIADFNNALAAAFDALDAKDTGAEKKMGTTLAFLKLHNQGATIAHMGDSRVYHIRPGKDGASTSILFQTEDHSLVQELVKIGEITREEARNSKQKNVITRAMQPAMARRPRADVYETADIRPGDFFYLCSDGMLEQPEMDDGISLRNIFSQQVDDDVRRVEILKGATYENRDNHTAIIVHILEVIDPIPVQPVKTVGQAKPATAGAPHSTPAPALTTAPRPMMAQVHERAPRKKRGATGIIVAIIAVLAIVAACCVTLYLTRTPGRDRHDDKDYSEEVVTKKDHSPTTAKKAAKSTRKDNATQSAVKSASTDKDGAEEAEQKASDDQKADAKTENNDNMADIKDKIGKVSSEDPDDAKEEPKKKDSPEPEPSVKPEQPETPVNDPQ